MSLESQLTALANGFRKRFGVNSKLSIADMIKLVTPPAFQTVTLFSDKGYTYFNQHSYNIEIPKHSGTPIQVNVKATVQSLLDFSWKWECFLNDSGNDQSTVVSYIPRRTNETINLSIILPANDTHSWRNLRLQCNPLNGGVIRDVSATASEYLGG